ncbi:MAG: ArnT family glycosyltransferase [Planctomycetaceae bacterium]
MRSGDRRPATGYGEEASSVGLRASGRDPGTGIVSRKLRLFVGAVFALQLVLGCDAARRLTVTHDEYWHLPVGLLNLKTGRFDYDNLNPPLIRMAAAAPLLLHPFAKDFAVDYQADATAYGDAFVQHARQNPLATPSSGNYDGWYTIGRFMIVLLTVATGLTLAIWARELFGDRAALLAAVLWLACPNILAHGSLVTTDLGAAAFFVFTLFAAWKHAAQPTWTRTVVWGVLLGLAQVAKYTSVLLIPLSLAVWLIRRVRNSEMPPIGWKRTVSHATMVCVLCGLVWNAGYLFDGSFASLGSYTFRSQTLSRLNGVAALQHIPVPLPRQYIAGLDRQKQIMESPHPVFLDGQWNTEGFASYYPMTLLYKLSHGLQLLIVCAALFLVSPGAVSRNGRLQAAILVPAAAMILAASAGGMQLGIRYILPAVPFLILFAAQSAQWCDWSKFRARTAVVALLTLVACASLRYHPNHITYFNELAGGPVGGRAHLLDSNLDWGQDLRGLKEWMDANGHDEIGLAYFSTVPPSFVGARHQADIGIRYHLPPSRMPQPGWYAVSVNFVMGRPHVLRDGNGKFRPADIGEFAYFGFFEPAARIGYSIDVYHITDADVARWRAAMARQMLR